MHRCALDRECEGSRGPTEAIRRGGVKWEGEARVERAPVAKNVSTSCQRQMSLEGSSWRHKTAELTWVALLSTAKRFLAMKIAACSLPRFPSVDESLTSPTESFGSDTSSKRPLSEEIVKTTARSAGL